MRSLAQRARETIQVEPVWSLPEEEQDAAEKRQ
jgi:hypothetical protein